MEEPIIAGGAGRELDGIACGADEARDGYATDVQYRPLSRRETRSRSNKGPCRDAACKQPDIYELGHQPTPLVAVDHLVYIGARTNDAEARREQAEDVDDNRSKRRRAE